MSAANDGSRASLTGGDSPFPHATSGDLVPWPWLNGAMLPHKDGGNYPSPPEGYSAAPGKAQYSALRLGSSVAIMAKGELGYLNQIADIRQGPWRILPPQFQFFIYTPRITLPAMRAFAFSEIFPFPMDAKTLVIHDIEGPQTIEISEPKNAALASLAEDRALRGADAQLAMGLGASLQEAFDHAVAQLPSTPKHPDQLFTYTIVESGLMRGGFAGLHRYYAKVAVKS